MTLKSNDFLTETKAAMIIVAIVLAFIVITNLTNIGIGTLSAVIMASLVWSRLFKKNV